MSRRRSAVLPRPCAFCKTEHTGPAKHCSADCAELDKTSERSELPHECVRCGNRRRELVKHPFLHDSDGPFLYCRACMRVAAKAAHARLKDHGDAGRELIERFERAATGDAFDPRQLTIGGA